MTATDLPTLTSERLVLRPFAATDGPDVERLAGAREVADTTLHVPHPYPAGAGAEWIATQGPAWAAGVGLTLAIAPREAPDRLLGAVSLALAREHARGELGYWVAVHAWGRGYATEAARAVAGYGFGALSLHRVQARHFTRNPASGRVMQKLGMRFEGVHRGSYLRWGRFEDVAVYGILAHEWAASPGAVRSGGGP
jgi:RimJ/RimL family protein N-acetyltransferase